MSRHNGVKLFSIQILRVAYLSLRLLYKAGGIVRGRSKTSTRELKKKRTKKEEQLLESALDCRAFSLI